MAKNQDYIEVQGARAHNLKNIDIKIPREQLVVITGLSGSGKSSLAFDTIYAEGQRRYIETFSAYARQFLGGLERPDVDKIDGLSPVIAIEQKTTNKNPRSTVGTITEIYDFLRLLYARTADAYSYVTDKKMVSYSDEQVKELILSNYFDKKIVVLAPVIKSRKGHYRELFETIAKQGFTKVRVDGTIVDITKGMKLDRYKTHDIEIVIDRLKISEHIDNDKRLTETIKTAMYHGENILLVIEHNTTEARYFSRDLMCPVSGISYPTPEPNSFSFNSPKGACDTCNGIGHLYEVNTEKIIPNTSISIQKGGIAPLGEYKNSWMFKQLETIAERYHFKLTDAIKKIPNEALKIILHGGNEQFSVESKNLGVTRNYKIDFEGIVSFINNQYHDSSSSSIKRWAKEYMDNNTCSTCQGSRLKKESLYFKINDKNIAELAQMDVIDLTKWMNELDEHLSDKQKQIGAEVVKEIKERLQFLLDVGLDYLALNRSSKTLSGGEAQRIRLAGLFDPMLAVTTSAVAFAVRSVVDPGLPANGGAMRPLDIVVPRGSIVAAEPPAAVGAGNVEVSQRVADVVFAALARAAPERVAAAAQGTMNNVLMGGAGWVYYETVGGGQGGSCAADDLAVPGDSGVHTGMTNTKNTPIEALERAFPLRVLRYRLRRGSGGAGLAPGGEGIERDLQVLEDVTVSLITERRVSRPPGLAGGDDGATGENWLLPAGDEDRAERLPDKCTIRLVAGDVLRMATPGGGGWGAPGHRPGDIHPR